MVVFSESECFFGVFATAEKDGYIHEKSYFSGGIWRDSPGVWLLVRV